MSINWIPLESNPDVLNNFIENLGVTTDWKFVDVYGFDDESIQFIPSPTVVSIILLYPLSEVEDDIPVGDSSPVTDKDVYFMKQTIGNACGAMAILHAVANNTNMITFTEDSSLKKFIDKTKNLSPYEKADLLVNSPEINNTHQDCAQTGQTAAPDPTSHVDCHFIALVQVNGVLYEMDGRKQGPVAHGPSSADTFVSDAIKVCRKYVDKNPQCLRFTAVALCKDPF